MGVKVVTARGDVPEGSNTDLSASGGSLQPARPRCRSILAPPRKRCSASGTAWDFVREKIFLEASRWVRLAQQPPDNAMKSMPRAVSVPARFK